MGKIFKTAVIYRLSADTLNGKGRGVEVTPLTFDLAHKFIDNKNDMQEFSFLDSPDGIEWNNAVYVLASVDSKEPIKFYLITPL